MKRISVVLLLFFVSTLILAQDKAATKAGAKPAAKASAPAGPPMPIPKPAPEMQKLLSTLSGKWNLAIKEEPNEFSPGGNSTGTSNIHAGPGNLSVMEMVEAKSPAMTFSGHGTMWWDAKAGVYHGVWCDNMTPSGCDASTVAKWQGDNLVLTSTSEMAGKKYNNRNTYSDIKPGSFTVTFESAKGTDPMKKVMTINYKKAAAAKAAAQ